jgi:predicted XRE-type DNA-binding protein
MAKKNKHFGSSIDDLMKEEGWFDEAQEKAIKEVIAWQLSQAMEKKKISKSTMATRLKTSRTQVNRILNAKSDVTLSSLQRAAALVGRRLKVELV